MARRVGKGISVAADGSAAATVSFSSAFNETPAIICSISNNYAANPWHLGYQTTGETQVGFEIIVEGGPAGSFVTISYVAYGEV